MAIPQKQQNILLLKSGNRCAFPGCRRILVAGASSQDEPVVLGEIAHIVAESPLGPRGNNSLSLFERNQYGNLILLCNQHHQLIDSQPQTYSIEKLQAIKSEHETWVDQTLNRGEEIIKEILPKKQEILYSTLLPVQRMPIYVYGVPCELRREKDVSQKLIPLRNNEMAPFILREGMLYTFQNLNHDGNPFSNLVPGQSAERFLSEEWWTDENKMRWFIELTNRALNKLTGRQDLRLDKEHRRYYFQSAEPGEELEVEYRPLNQKSAKRKVVWQPIRRKTGEHRKFWYHRAISLKFIQIGLKEWCLAIRPELRVTKDGLTSIDSKKIGRRVTKVKSHRFNYDLLAEVNFWRDFLGSGTPRIIMSFGSGQAIVISTSLMNGEIAWPGIPEQYNIPFKNTEYIDDLFSWAEMSQLDLHEEEEEIEEDSEESEEEYET